MVVKSHGMIWDSGSFTSNSHPLTGARCLISGCTLVFQLSPTRSSLALSARIFTGVMGWLKAIGAAVELWQRQYPTRSPVLNSLFARRGWTFGCFSNVQRCRITVGPFTFITDTMIQFDSIRVWNILQAFGTALYTVTSLLKWSKPTHLLAPSIYARRRSWQSSCPWKQIRISVMISWSKGGSNRSRNAIYLVHRDIDIIRKHIY